ncbi:hypothetical protein DXG01_006341 [Tephrocybe rancida]|nr:hypothetical protein DXG01_006341 [Tephrocybe rancida]
MFASTSWSTTTLASTSGYLDTPTMYREMVERNTSADEFHEVEMFADHDGASTNPPMLDSLTHPSHRNAAPGQVPPRSRRLRRLHRPQRTLIGTAVGLTVYRPPPPPYRQGAWTPSAPPQITPATPTTPCRRRGRRAVTSASAGKRSIAHRRKHIRPPLHHATHAHATTTTVPNRFPPLHPEFDFAPGPTAEPMEVEDQIVEKLSMLIEEDKRPLNREIVVTSDAREDDGSGPPPPPPPPHRARDPCAARLNARRALRPLPTSSLHRDRHTRTTSPSHPARFAFAPSTSAPHMTMMTPQRCLSLAPSSFSF